jgi:hypothetical protein
MLNCSTCHKKKPTEHFYDYPEHRAHIPMHASPEDSEALACLLADGLLDEDAASQTPTRARSTLAHAREQLATSGRPVESAAQRARREAAEARAMARAEEAEAAQAEADAPWPWWMKAGAWVGGIAFAGAVGWGLWRDTHA